MGEMLLNGRLYGASGIRELTQAQYDALPASKLTDGVLYCIKDTGIVEGDKYAPIIYSLEEREIGVWTNGKPLYERVFDFSTALSIQPSTWTATNIDSTDIEKIVYCAGLHSDGTCYMFIGADPTQTNHTKVGLWSTRSTTTTVKGVILRYTKISDITGSGQWGTDGVPMVHYDGTENIIGTWLDRMTGASVPLYEKLIRFGSNGSSGKNSSDISNNILSNLNIRECIDCYFLIWQDSTYRKHQLYYNSNTQLLSNYPSSSWTTHLVVRYTKTT